MQESAYSRNPSETPAPASPIPSRGEVALRVRYCECDPMGVAHHSAFIPWFEIGRTELLRASGLTYAAMEAAGVLLAVTRIEARYHRPARYDQTIVVVTSVTGGGRARIDHAYEAWLDREDGRGKCELLATASSTLACIDRNGRPRPLPDWLRADRHTG